ncbi:MAG: cysteine desulfurase [Bacteroidia bacterium]|nr:cysteine desulfurase [Bacteroidia bacterium]
MRIYFDNTASTPLDPEVIRVMHESLKTNFGNPSSVHHYGREARVVIEKTRSSIAELLNVSPAEIFFTSGGTEANNTVIYGCIHDLGIHHAITFPIEHHAVLHTLEHFKNSELITLDLLDVDHKGHIKLEQLEKLLQQKQHSLVCLMHANNELSNLLPIEEISKICVKYNAVFHSDMVQTITRYDIDLKKAGVDFASSSAHKFHGPKGVGFLYINLDKVKIHPLIHGGGQERNMRAGTENLHGIIGMYKAIEVGYKEMEQSRKKISELKKYMLKRLQDNFPGVNFIGDSAEDGLYTILSVQFPENSKAEMLLTKLDIEGIAASGGSACTSGAESRSHVLDAIKAAQNRQIVRFSFSKFNNVNEIDFCIDKLKKILL